MAFIEVAKSDCLDVQTEQEGTLLISYSNPGDYDDIPYSSFGTPPTFVLRIHARLNEHLPRSVQEDENIMESDGDVESLMTSSKTQIELEVFKVPEFMHNKIESALKHKTVTITVPDGTIYSMTKEEAYDRAPGRKDNPLRKASCWLTVRGSYKTNVQ